MSATECKTCQHGPSDHSPMVGCYAATDDGKGFCNCPQYVAPPSRNETLTEGRARRDDGMAKAGTGTPGVLSSDWRDKAAEAMAELAATGEEFSADDLVEKVGPPPHPNMLGPTFGNAARADLINAVGFRQATRASAHARVQRTWKGKG